MYQIAKWKTDQQKTQPFNYTKRDEGITSGSSYSANPRVEAWPHWGGLVRWCHVRSPLGLMRLCRRDSSSWGTEVWNTTFIWGPLTHLGCFDVSAYKNWTWNNSPLQSHIYCTHVRFPFTLTGKRLIHKKIPNCYQFSVMCFFILLHIIAVEMHLKEEYFPDGRVIT